MNIMCDLTQQKMWRDSRLNSVFVAVVLLTMIALYTCMSLAYTCTHTCNLVVFNLVVCTIK